MGSPSFVVLESGGGCRDAAEPVYNPFAPGFAEDPYPQYAALRDGDPVHQNPFGVWMVTRYDDVRTLLRDPLLSVEDRHMHPTPLSEIAAEAMGDAADMGSRSMLNLDPPAHTRLRRLVSKAFTPRMVERLRGRVEQLGRRHPRRSRTRKAVWSSWMIWRFPCRSR